MNQLKTLIDLVTRLYTESADFADHPDDSQLWYNRGYANGMLKALGELNHLDSLRQPLTPDGPDSLATTRWTVWGKAYQHGLEKGYQETLEVLDPTACHSL